MKNDTKLLKVYMKGFNDELDGKIPLENPNPLLFRAYNLGRDDAFIGDELTSSDLQTNEDILSRIKAS